MFWLETEMRDAKDDEIRKLKEENSELRIQLAEPQKEDTETQTIQDIESHNNAQTGILVELIDEKLNCGLKAIQANVSKLIDEKLINQSKSLVEDKATMQTYASAARSMNSAMNKDPRAIMLETKHEEIAEELDRKSRVNNLIMANRKSMPQMMKLLLKTCSRIFK